MRRRKRYGDKEDENEQDEDDELLRPRVVPLTRVPSLAAPLEAAPTPREPGTCLDVCDVPPRHAKARTGLDRPMSAPTQRFRSRTGRQGVQPRRNEKPFR